jgi:hypothetical protein
VLSEFAFSPHKDHKNVSKPTPIETPSPNSPFLKHLVDICGQNGPIARLKIETIGALEAKTYFSDCFTVDLPNNPIVV